MTDTQWLFVGAIDCLADRYRSGGYDEYYEAEARRAWAALSLDERREAVEWLDNAGHGQVVRRLFGVPG